MSVKRRVKTRFSVGMAIALSMVAGWSSGADAQSPQPIGFQVTSPPITNSCLLGSCATHSPLPDGSSVESPFVRTVTFANGDTYEVNGTIYFSVNSDASQFFYFVPLTVTFVRGNGPGGTSVGAPDTFVFDQYTDFAPIPGGSYSGELHPNGAFSPGVASGSSVTIGQSNCGVPTDTLGPFVNPPSTFNQLVSWSVPSCDSDFLTDTTYTISFQSGTQPGSYIVHFPGPPLFDSHDFNGDLYSDILWRDTSGNLALWMMNGGATLQAGGIANVSTSFSIVGQHDFRGDGKADIVWRDGSGNLYIWFMSGLHISSTASLGNVPLSWSINGTSDLNGDGKGDLLWRNTTTGTVAIWFMNDGQISSTATLGNVAGNWSIIGDDNNGNIYWRDTAGDVAIWQVSGLQFPFAVSLGNVPTNWVIAGIGDFNGDGIGDILWYDNNTGTVAIWFLTSSATIQSTTVLGRVSGTWKIVQTGAYKSAVFAAALEAPLFVTSDILWLDGSGNVAIWFINNGQFSSAASLGNVGTAWKVQSANAGVISAGVIGARAAAGIPLGWGARR